MKSIFANIKTKYSKEKFNPAFCKYYVPVAQLQSNILKKGELQLKPHLYCYK